MMDQSDAFELLMRGTSDFTILYAKAEIPKKLINGIAK